MGDFDPDQVVIDADSRIYVVCGDACMQTGVAAEACSLAGTMCLKNLILIYDDNGFTIDGGNDVAFAEDVLLRFRAYGWHTVSVEDGNEDLDGIYNAICEAKKQDRPTLIKVKTIIGYGASKQNSSEVHGGSLGE